MSMGGVCVWAMKCTSKLLFFNLKGIQSYVCIELGKAASVINLELPVLVRLLKSSDVELGHSTWWEARAQVLSE